MKKGHVLDHKRMLLFLFCLSVLCADAVNASDTGITISKATGALDSISNFMKGPVWKNGGLITVVTGLLGALAAKNMRAAGVVFALAGFGTIFISLF